MREWVRRYIEQARACHDAIQGLSPVELTAHPVAGAWSIQQIVFHLMDSDLIGSDRMKRVIAEDRPQLIAYDESAFARSLFYQELAPQPAADLFCRNRLLTAEILHRLPDLAFDRVGVHSERGEMTLGTLLQVYVEHVEHHLKFVRQKRALLGKP